MRPSLALIAPALAIGMAIATPGSAAGASSHFLTLPFASTSHMHVQRGWWAMNLLHHGIDFIEGVTDVPVTWISFAVIAAAPGQACAQVVGKPGCYVHPGEKMGNRVLVRHRVAGQTFYTFYNDLRSIAPGIPVGSSGKTAFVARGAPIGMAGAGENPPDLIHLHFELLDAHYRPIDPYGIYGHAFQYPDPAGGNRITSARRNYWVTNPPTPPGPVVAGGSAAARSRAASSSTPASASAASPRSAVAATDRCLGTVASAPRWIACAPSTACTKCAAAPQTPAPHRLVWTGEGTISPIRPPVRYGTPSLIAAMTLVGLAFLVSPPRGAKSQRTRRAQP